MKSILCVVDDEPEILDTYQEFFQEKYRVYTFECPKTFLRQLDEKKILPDAVVTDYKMPGMNGIELIAQVRERKFEFPFVLLSGHIIKEVALDAIEMGSFSVLEKPIPFDKLLNVVDRMMLEVELAQTRRDIRTIIVQIKELYEGIRESIFPHVPPEVRARFFVEAKEGVVTRKLGLEEVLQGLEQKLEKMLKAENALMLIRSRHGEP